MTKRGTDPLLSEAENTGTWIEPPTAVEMERAITGNIANLMTVVCIDLSKRLGLN